MKLRHDEPFDAEALWHERMAAAGLPAPRMYVHGHYQSWNEALYDWLHGSSGRDGGAESGRALGKAVGRMHAESVGGVGTVRSGSWEAAQYGPFIEVAWSRYNLGVDLSEQGRYEDALVEVQMALEIFRDALGPDHVHVAMSLTSMADILLELRRSSEALALAEQGWSRLEGDGVPPELRAAGAFVCARALWGTDQTGEARARAHALARRAREIAQTLGDDQAEQLAEVEAWLKDHPPP